MITKTVTLDNGAPVTVGKITSLVVNPVTLRLNAVLSLYVDSGHMTSGKSIQNCPVNQVITSEQLVGNLIALAETLAIAQYSYLSGATQS